MPFWRQRLGTNGVIAMCAAAMAAPDGYTLLRPLQFHLDQFRVLRQRWSDPHKDDRPSGVDGHRHHRQPSHCEDAQWGPLIRKLNIEVQ